MSMYNSKLSEKTRESNDPMMDLISETFSILSHNVELMRENKRLKAKIRNLEVFIRVMKGFKEK